MKYVAKYVELGTKRSSERSFKAETDEEAKLIAEEYKADVKRFWEDDYEQIRDDKIKLEELVEIRKILPELKIPKNKLYFINDSDGTDLDFADVTTKTATITEVVEGTRTKCHQKPENGLHLTITFNLYEFRPFPNNENDVCLKDEEIIAELKKDFEVKNAQELITKKVTAYFYECSFIAISKLES